MNALSRTLMRRGSVVRVLAFIVLVSLLTMVPVAYSQTVPTVTTDKADYAPGETVIITGTGFTPGNKYAVPVKRPDGSIVTIDPVTHQVVPGWEVITAGADGSFTYEYLLNGIVGLYEVRVYDSPWLAEYWDDGVHEPVASTTFTDGALDWTQCRNDSDNDNIQDDCDWVTGSLGSNNSIYTEGEVVPHRKIRLIDTAGSHYVTIDHSFYDSSKDAYTYDFFATPDVTLGSDLAPCVDLPTGGAWAPFFGGGSTNCESMVTGKSEVAIPTESTYPTSSPAYTYPFVAGAEADALLDGVTRNLWISCGAFVDDDADPVTPDVFETGKCTNISLEILGHGASNGTLLPDQDGPPTVDDYVQVKISYNTTEPDTMVAIWVGAHVAREFYWDYVSDPDYQAKGAATAAGASFHVRLIDWDENQAIGNRDNQMQTGAVVPPAIKTGYKWNDLNADHVWQKDTGVDCGGEGLPTCEPGLEGWTIYVDYDGDGELDGGIEPFGVTDATGYYEIELIKSGTWKVREVPQEGWTCSFPTTTDAHGCYHQEDFLGGFTYPDNNFGNYQVLPSVTIDKSGDDLSKIGDDVWSFIKSYPSRHFIKSYPL